MLDRELRSDRSRLKPATTAAEGITVVTCSFGDFFREQSLESGNVKIRVFNAKPFSVCSMQNF